MLSIIGIREEMLQNSWSGHLQLDFNNFYLQLIHYLYNTAVQNPMINMKSIHPCLIWKPVHYLLFFWQLKKARLNELYLTDKMNKF